MQYFNFSRLINKYKSEFILIYQTEGYFNELGDWVNDSAEKTLEGAIISFKESKIFRSEGTLTANDKRLFMLESLGEIIDSMKVIHGGKLYNIEDCTQNAKFTGVYAYTLRYVSAFMKTTPDYDITDEIDDFEKRLDGTLNASDSDIDTSEEETFELADDLQKRLDGTLNG